MFWRFGGYANISTIDTILEKPDFTIEDLLDESDLIQELKQHNSKLIEYLREDKVLEKLLEYVIAPKLEPVATPEIADDSTEDKGKGRLLPFSRPRATSRAAGSENEEEESEKKRNRYAYVAAEVLSSDTWSIYEALMEDQALIREFWNFLKRDTPLDPLQASYFTKVNEALFDKKTEEMVELLKSLPEAVADLLRHVECPMIMDLLLKIIALDRTDGGQGIVEWLYSQDVIPTLLSCLSPEHNWVVQTAAGDFIKAIITISANASQNEQQCIGPNELTRQLVSRDCVEQLIQYMLGGGNPLTVGVGIVIEVIRKNNSDYDPDVGAEANSVPSSRDPIYLGTLLRLFAQHVPDFMNLIMHAPLLKQKRGLESTFGEKIEPLGFDRFKTCELMAELLHCSNMGLLNEVGSEEVIAARDSERQRLRKEGKLTPNRGEEAPSSVEDLTMRIGHSSPEEGRRLEVTNVSDDDGFEEVEHSGEMNEDTSHEFVKAEDEIRNVPASSFLDKDGDDFVDEPISSPRLVVSEAKIAEQEFDDPDLVVAPLSPTKPKFVSPADTKKPATSIDSKGEEPKEGTENPGGDMAESQSDVLPDQKAETEAIEVAKDKSDPEVKLDQQTDDTALKADGVTVAQEPQASSAQVTEGGLKDEETDSSVVYTPSVSEAEEKACVAESDQLPSVVEAGGSQPDLSPHVEDTPAPLFANKLTGDESTTAATTSVGNADATVAPELPEAPEAPAPPPKDAALPSDPVCEPVPSAAKVEDSDSSSKDVNGDCGSVDPVVGDYLKMQFVDYGVVPTILSFFFAYPWNNFLHNVVYDIVQQVFNGPMDRGCNPTLAVSLFEAADITTAIINGQLASDESQAKMKTRMGYMGHLTLIAEEVVKFTERHPPELLSETVLDRVMDQGWINYVEGALAETRERDNAILGGVRPEVALGNRAGMSGNGLAAVGLSALGSALSLSSSSQGANGSSALADAGLNGGIDVQENGGNGIGPFAISAGTLMSGFGSSSDEEDDDGEENDDDVNHEFRAYTDPLNNSGSSSLNPPSIPPPPPPPPPLNIPPSRARLQLAARLAMHQKNSAANANTTSEGENGEAVDDDEKHGSASGEPEQLRNPFADDEEDEDADSDDDNADGRHASGAAAALTGAWGAPARGSWWRGVVRRKQPDKFGRADSDEDDAEDDDEEFGDFAMPEVTSAPGSDPNDKILKPLAVHPPVGVSATGPNQKSAFGSIWPFTSSSGTKDPKEDKAGVGEEESPEPGSIDENGVRVRAAVEAKRRTSIEDPDDEEVVV